MLENDFCNDRIRKDEVANICLSFNRKSKLEDSCNDEEEKSSEGENKGDKDDQFEANVNKSGQEWGEGTAETQHATNAAAEECCVDDCDGELEDNLKATINVNDPECNVIEDTEDNIGIIIQLEGNDVKVSLRDFGSYVKFDKECLHKGYKCGTVDTYLSAQLFPAPAVGQKRQKLACMNKTGRSKKKNIEGTQLSILKSISNEIQENWDGTYMDAKYNPGSMFHGNKVNKKKTRKMKHEHFPKLPHVEQLINIYENQHNE